MNISIIIFSYNEAENLSVVIDGALRFLSRAATDYEIIIVDDGSNDTTAEICRMYAQKSNKIHVIRHEYNRGIGHALRTGYASCRFDYVCAIPGDGQFDICELDVISPFAINTYYSFYRHDTNYSLYRRFLTWANRLFNQHILGIYLRDVNWIKVYRKEHIFITSPELKSSLVESEICSKLYKCNILPVEIPSKYLQRKHGVPRGGSFKTLSKVLSDMIPLWWSVLLFKPPKRF